MLTDEQLNEAIAAMPGEKVEMHVMRERIRDVQYTTLKDLGCPTVTICSIVLDNGYSVRGESACVDPSNFNEEIGRTIAYKQAFDKLWPLFGFLLAEKRLLRSQHDMRESNP